jgi:hypothetical protein
LWLHDIWREWRPRRIAAGGWQRAGQIAWETVWCAALVSVMLVFRSRTSLDFIYFQF